LAQVHYCSWQKKRNGFEFHLYGLDQTGYEVPMMDDQEMPGEKTLGSTGKRDLVFTRVFDAPVEQVWKAWTDPEQVKRWWGPDGFSCPFARIDFREGGISLVCMRAPKEFMGGQDMYSTWTYTKIVPLRVARVPSPLLRQGWKPG
jgi:hypothetical protein